MRQPNSILKLNCAPGSGFFTHLHLIAANPQLFAAARKAPEIRGDEGTGWSLGWKINLWARFRDGDRAYALARTLLRPVGMEVDGIKYSGGGVYPNFFDDHPPFQVDGNFAYTSGIAEMLLQSASAEIQLLPALPKAWPAGSVKGLRARGGFEVDIYWDKGTLVRAVVRSTAGTSCALRYGTKTISLRFKPGTTRTWEFSGQATQLPNSGTFAH